MTRLALAVVVAVVLAASAAGAWSVPVHASTTRDGTAEDRPTCPSVDRAFTPTRLAVGGLLDPTRVIARGRDRHGVPLPPPLTQRGRWQLAWDRASRTRPGGPSGVVRLTAHTYPQPRPSGPSTTGAPALGNLLLARLRTGARLEVTGPGGDRLCYRVTRRSRVRATSTLSGYYDTTGAPRLAILVCSGQRRGPGDWSHRTIWWAHPVLPGS